MAYLPGDRQQAGRAGMEMDVPTYLRPAPPSDWPGPYGGSDGQAGSAGCGTIARDRPTPAAASSGARSSEGSRWY